MISDGTVHLISRIDYETEDNQWREVERIDALVESHSICIDRCIDGVIVSRITLTQGQAIKLANIIFDAFPLEVLSEARHGLPEDSRP